MVLVFADRHSTFLELKLKNGTHACEECYNIIHPQALLLVEQIKDASF